METKWVKAEQELSAAKTEQKQADKNLKKLTEEEDISEDNNAVDSDINEILDRIGPEEIIEKLKIGSKAVEKSSGELKGKINGLIPWVGQFEQLPKTKLTEEQAKRLADRWTSLQADMKTAKDKFDDVTLKSDQLAARIAELESDETLISDKEAGDIKSSRNESWNHHVANMTISSAETFHQAMVHCDTVHDVRLGTAERLTHLREARLDLVELEASKSHFQDQLAAIKSDAKANDEIISAHLDTLQLPKGFDVRDLLDWLKKLSDAHMAVGTHKTESDKLSSIEDEVADAEKMLQEAISMGSDTALPELTRLARKSVADVAQQEARVVSRRENLDKASSALNKRREAVAEIEKNLIVIKDEWVRLASDLPIPLTTPSDFRAALPTLRELNASLSDQEKLLLRLDAMEKDYSNFEAEIQNHAKTLGEDTKIEPLALAEIIRERLRTAETNESLHKGYDEDIEEDTGKETKSDGDLLQIATDVEEKAKHYPAAVCIKSVEDLATAISNSNQAARLRLERSELESRIFTRLGSTDIEAALELLANADVPTTQARFDALKQDCSLAEEELEKSIGDLRSASDELKNIGGDDAVARLQEERQTTFLTLADQAKQNLRLRLGVMAAERALARYRDDHRSGMLSDTAKAFQTLTSGRYSDLQTQPDGQKEILLALRTNDKRSISVSDMSKGTRFQLYLALRLAGYNQFSSGGTTLPFIADDIMETFDNTRTSAAIELLQQMALRGQALYFTHHEHVVDLAREKCGDSVQIHELMST